MSIPESCAECRLSVRHFGKLYCPPLDGRVGNEGKDSRCPLHESVTIKDTDDKIKVTNCNDNISIQAICDALDKVFADRIKSAGFDSYETADRDTQLVCDGIMKAIDVVLDQPTVDHLADVSKRDLISRQAAIEVIDAVFPVDPMKTEYAQGIACGAALAKTYVEQMPSAQPEPKTGKWTVGDYDTVRGYWATCSSCGHTSFGGGKFCGECGARMLKEGEQNDNYQSQ